MRLPEIIGAYRERVHDISQDTRDPDLYERDDVELGVLSTVVTTLETIEQTLRNKVKPGLDGALLELQRGDDPKCQAALDLQAAIITLDKLIV